jgi:Leucine rich repeat
LCSASFATTSWILDAFDLRPHIPPTDSVSLPHDAPTVAAQTERFAAIRGVLLSISTAESLSQLHTPQMKALDWIANRDTLRLEPDAGHLLQRYALAVLYFATTELGWKRELNWLAPVHECEWSGEGGVRTCDTDRRVTDVSLWNNLKGTLPVELGALSKLQILYLARNHLYGTVPTELGQLTELKYLGLQFNRLTGTFPADYFGGLTKLRTIYLEKNDLTGTIKRTDPLCQLKFDASPPPGQPHSGGVLRQVTSDCRQLVKWKLPEVDCGCCSKCFAA